MSDEPPTTSEAHMTDVDMQDDLVSSVAPDPDLELKQELSEIRSDIMAWIDEAEAQYKERAYDNKDYPRGVVAINLQGLQRMVSVLTDQLGRFQQLKRIATGVSAGIKEHLDAFVLSIEMCLQTFQKLVGDQLRTLQAAKEAKDEAEDDYLAKQLEDLTISNTMIKECKERVDALKKDDA